MEARLSFWANPLSQYESLKEFYAEKLKVAGENIGHHIRKCY